MLPGAETLAEVYHLYTFACANGSSFAGTAFRLNGREGIFAALHTVNGCRIRKAQSTATKTEIPLQVCRVAIGFDVAVLDRSCTGKYTFPFEMPRLEDETYYVIGYPIRAGQFRRPVFLFRHENRPTARLDNLGLDPEIFGSAGKGLGLERSTPVVVIGGGVAPGDSGAPLVTKTNEVIGIVGGGRREIETGALVGITWATAIGPELARALQPAAGVQKTLDEIARKPSNQFFTNEPLKRITKGVEFVELPVNAPNGEPVRSYWVMTAEASQKEYHDCVREGTCRAGSRYDLSLASRPALLGRVEDARRFCDWLGGPILDKSVWSAAASLPQIGQTVPYLPGSVNLKGFSKAREHQSALDVRSTRPNEQGIYDLFGNVWEWIDTPEQPGSVAGGAFNTPHQSMTCNALNCDAAIRKDARAGTIGVRCMIPTSREAERSESAQ